MKTLLTIIRRHIHKVIPASLLYIGLAILLVAFSFRPHIRIYTIGDSTMANKSTNWDNPEFGWGQLLKTHFDSSHVIIENHAKDGRSSKSFLREGRWDTVMNRMKAGDYVFIQFGHNDQKREQTDLYASPENYRDNLSKFILDTRKKGGHPVLITSIVRRKYDTTGNLVQTLEGYPDIMRELAKELNTPLIDLEKRTRELLTIEGPEKSKAFYIHLKKGQHPAFPNGREDNTHLSKLGAMTISEMVAEEINRLNIPIKKFLLR